MMTNKVTPITPEEATKAAEAQIPDVVFEAVNHLITKNARKATFRIKAKDIVDEILRRDKESDTSLYLTRDILYDRGWMDFEYAYRKAGWKVIYDRPGYNESYDAFYEFTKQNKDRDWR